VAPHTSTTLLARLEALSSALAADLRIEPPVGRMVGTRRVLARVRPPRRGRPALLIVSRGAIEKLDPMALRWVVAHELGHLADRAGLRRLQVMRRWSVLCLVAVFLAVALLPPPLGALLGMPVLLFCGRKGAALKRDLEREADRTAHRCCAADPEAGRRALTVARVASGIRPERLFHAMQSFAGYPPFDERMEPRPG
jgi:Zn-dependent protease with chaperone function